MNWPEVQVCAFHTELQIGHKKMGCEMNRLLAARGCLEGAKGANDPWGRITGALCVGG